MRTDTIPHLAEAAALQWPEAPALIENGESWTFAELWAECREAAGAFLAYGIGEGDRIAIWAPNCREWIVTAVGAMTVGAAIVPLNTRLKGREAGDILRRTNARMLFTVDEFLGTNYQSLINNEELPGLESIILLRAFVSSCEIPQASSIFILQILCAFTSLRELSQVSSISLSPL